MEKKIVTCSKNACIEIDLLSMVDPHVGYIVNGLGKH